jgi:formyltetrahydrofolate hydrolase
MAAYTEQCPNEAYRRMIERAQTSNIHTHLGAEHVAGFLPERDCNILDSAQSRDEPSHQLFMRVALETWRSTSLEQLTAKFTAVRNECPMRGVVSRPRSQTASADMVSSSDKPERCTAASAPAPWRKRSPECTHVPA